MYIYITLHYLLLFLIYSHSSPVSFLCFFLVLCLIWMPLLTYRVLECCIKCLIYPITVCVPACQCLFSTNMDSIASVVFSATSLSFPLSQYSIFLNLCRLHKKHISDLGCPLCPMWVHLVGLTECLLNLLELTDESTSEVSQDLILKLKPARCDGVWEKTKMLLHFSCQQQ